MPRSQPRENETTENHDEDSVQNVCRLVKAGQMNEAVCACLGQSRIQIVSLKSNFAGSACLDASLFVTPQDCLANNLYRDLFQGGTVKEEMIPLVLEALLWIPPWFDVGYHSIVQVTSRQGGAFQSYLAQSCSDGILGIMSLVQEFLHQSLCKWLLPNHENWTLQPANEQSTTKAVEPTTTRYSSMTPRRMMKQVTDNLVQGFYEKDDVSQTLLEQLIQTLVSVAGMIEVPHHVVTDASLASLQAYITETAFQNENYRNNLLAVKLASLLSDGVVRYPDTQDLRNQLIVHTKETLVARENRQDLMKWLLLLCTRQPPPRGDPSSHGTCWHACVMAVLTQGSGAELNELLGLVECHIQKLSMPALQIWTCYLQQLDPQHAQAEDCIQVHLLLYLWNASKKSALENALCRHLHAARGEKGKPKDVDTSSACWNKVLSLLSGEMTRKMSLDKAAEEGRRLLNHVYYAGQGDVLLKDMSQNDQASSLSLSRRYATMLHGCMFLDIEIKDEGHGHVDESVTVTDTVVKRAELWINAVSEVILSRETQAWIVEEVIVAVLTLVICFVDIPVLRPVIVQTMQKQMSNDERSTSAISSTIVVMAVDMIVQSFRCRQESMHEELTPLTELLSIRSDMFKSLASALMPLHCGKEKILQQCQSLLDSPPLEFKFSPTAAGLRQDCFERAITGLCLVLELQKESNDLAWQAEVILCDLLVMKKPMSCWGSLSARTFLFAHLTSLVEKCGCLSQETKLHLLTASLSLLLSYCVTLQSKSSQGRTICLVLQSSSPRWEEDFVGLVCFIVTLAKTSLDNAMFAKSRQLLVAMLTEKDGNDMLSQVVEHEVESLDSDRLPSMENLIACSVGAVLQCVIRQSDKKSNQTAKQDVVVLLQDSVLRNDYTKDLFNRGAESRNPKWIQTVRTANIRAFRSRTKEMINVSPTLVALCDILTMLMVDHRQSSPLNAEKKARLCVCMKFMVRQKNRAFDRFVKAQEKSKVVRLPRAYNAITFDASCAVFEAAATISRKVSRLPLIQVDSVISCVLSYCDYIRDHTELVKSDSRKVASTCKSLWNLYSAVANEERSKAWLNYLETASVEEQMSGSQKQGSNETFSLLKLSSGKDVDEAIRYMRLAICSTLLFLLESLQRIAKSSDDRLDANSPESGPINGSSTLPIEFWMNCLVSFPRDLRMGVTGDSGGFTTKLFSTFLDLIDVATARLHPVFEGPSRVPENLSLRLMSATLQAKMNLWGIVCTESVNYAPVFKKTIRLVLIDLQLLHLAMATLQHEDGRDSYPLDNAVVLVFEQCFKVYLRWLNADELTHWAEIAGNGHLDSIEIPKENSDDDTDNSDDDMPGGTNQNRWDHVPAVINVRTQSDVVSEVGENFVATPDGLLKLPSEKIWSCAFTSSLSAMEQSWGFNTWALLEDIDDSFEDPGLRARCTAYSAFRTKQLSDSLNGVCSLLQTGKHRQSHSKQTKKTSKGLQDDESTVLSVDLPGETKLKLCSCLDKISSVLKWAVRSLVAFVKSKNALPQDHESNLWECITCLLAWLTGKPTDVDITSGTRRWHHVENEMESRARENRPSVAAQNSILVKLQKTTRQMDELEREVQKLGFLLQKEQGATASAILEVFRDIQLEGDVGQESIQSLIADKMDSASHPDGFGPVVITEVSLSDDANVGKTKKKRKLSASEKRLRKKKRKRVIRSRNTVIDEMLQRDREAGHDAGNDEDDAFVDLEDFLVEG